MRAIPSFDLDRFLDIPRVTGLAVSPDGTRLVTAAAKPDAAGKRFASALWEVDPAGARPARRLTRSSPGESTPAFLPDGSLLFTSTRPDPDAKSKDGAAKDDGAGLWLLPSGGGEARLLAAPSAGVAGIGVARTTGTMALSIGLHPGASTPEDDEAKEKARTDAGVEAQLFERYPVRYWDHFLPLRELRLHVVAPPEGDEPLGDMRDLTPAPGRALDEAAFAISPDGTTIVTGWNDDSILRPRRDLVAIDTVTGERRTLRSEDGGHEGAAFSPDGRWLATTYQPNTDPTTPPEVHLVLVNPSTGEARRLAADLDRWPHAPAWAPDSSAVYFVADDHGHTPIFRVEVESGEVTRLTEEGSHHDVCPSPDGTRVYAIRSTPLLPPHVVAVDARAERQDPVVLPSPAGAVDVPGRVERVCGTASDGTEIEAWLVLPAGASATAPAPLVMFIHGGPLGSWAGWHWRWNPHLLAARGYAVLCPDPALSTGYGQHFVERGRGRWGEEPYTDLLAVLDATVARDDIDEHRTAAMGGSFGGYMANWIAGHTDRFRCIVTHASLWALDQFHGTTDLGSWWEQEFGDPYEDLTRYRESSPHLHVGKISTPMLVIHGEKDHRVPIGEALRLWTDLQRHDVPSKFLYFPDENHWVLKPQNARVWYETVFAWLDQHVLGEEWSRPPMV